MILAECMRDDLGGRSRREQKQEGTKERESKGKQQKQSTLGLLI